VWAAPLDGMPMTALIRNLATMARVGVIAPGSDGTARRSRSWAEQVKAVSDPPFGGTACALPMVYAHPLEREVDTFVVYTDSETWAGNVHPAPAQSLS
jgi:TROVE domain